MTVHWSLVADGLLQLGICFHPRKAPGLKLKHINGFKCALTKYCSNKTSLPNFTFANR